MAAGQDALPPLDSLDLPTVPGSKVELTTRAEHYGTLGPVTANPAVENTTKSIVTADYTERIGNEMARTASGAVQLVQSTSIAYDSNGVSYGDEWLDGLSAETKEKLSWNLASGWRIVPFGQLRGEAIYAQTAQAADAVVFFLAPTSLGIRDDQFTVHGKTSQLNFLLTGPKIGDWQSGGAIIMNFLGQQPLRNQSGPNVINAFGELKNDRWRFAFGRMLDLFGPITASTVNGGQQRAAGNIGIFRGGIHIDRFIQCSDLALCTLSGRISQNTTNDFLLSPTARGVDNGLPNFEGRIGLKVNSPTTDIAPFEIGFSALWGETRAFDPGFIEGDILRAAATEVSTTAGGCIDLQLQSERMGLRGEFWMAQAAGTYFVGILQTLNPSTGNGIRSVGGWAEVYFKATDRITFYSGYGIDDPRNQDLGFYTDPMDPNDFGQRTLNQVAWSSLMFAVTPSVQLAGEISHRETHYLNPIFSEQGMLYHFASTLKY